MLLILIVLGSISLLLGIAFLIGPDNVRKLEAMLNRPIVKTQEFGYHYSKLIGLVLLILSGVLLYINWSLR
ncbi:MAG: hypothetical protein ABIG56_06010 [Candidatus Omnitrophota bacterium]